MNPDAPGVSVPHEIAAGRNQKVPEPVTAPASPAAAAEAAAGSGVDANAPAPPVSASRSSKGYAPDPEPLRLQDQWNYTLSYRNGAVQIEAVQPVKLDAPVVTVRRMGRFAIELWVGAELVERVRFDFPLLGAQPADSKNPDGSRPMREPPRFKVDATVDVRVPASPRATRAVLVDRATGETTSIDWPPDAPIADPGQGSGPEPGSPAESL